MKIENIACLVFSPTGGCLEMVEGIKGFIKEYEVKTINVTRPKIREKITEIPKEIDYLIIAFPVYGEELPNLFEEHLKSLSINNIPVSLIAGYGNVDQGKALNIASTIIEDKGIVVCSACAIVTKHSYNGGRVQIAVNEPTNDKQEILNRFILKSIEKADKENKSTICKVNIPKGKKKIMARFPQKTIPQIYVKQPKVNLELCNHCNTCINVCPAGAIDEQLNIDNSKCIRCLACVKYCESKARVFETRYKMLESILMKEGQDIKENVFYI